MTKTILPYVRFYMEADHGGDVTTYQVMLGTGSDPVPITCHLPLAEAVVLTIRLQQVLDWANKDS